MIRFTWLQFRPQALIAATGLVVVAAVLTVTGPGLFHLYGTDVAVCQAHNDCQSAAGAYLLHDRALQIILRYLVLAVPGVLGIFWGAPLIARELEAGTFRFAWTQSVTRTRWMAVRLGVAGLATGAVAGLLSLMLTWWSSPLDTAGMNPFGSFDERGIVPVGYAAFGFALGVTAGVLMRRTVPAMAVTLAGFAAVRGILTGLVRPNLIAPLHLISPYTLAQLTGNANATTPDPRDWLVSDQVINGSGRVIGQNALGGNLAVGPRGVSLGGLGSCPSLKTPGHRVQNANALMDNLINRCLAQLQIRHLISYQPVSRYWTLQCCETAIYIVLAVILAGAGLWWTRRRLT